MTNPRRFAGILVVIILAGGGYFLGRFLGFTGGIPGEFTNARLQGALIAQNIVNLSHESALDLSEINKLERTGKIADALNTTTEVVQKSQEIRDRAVDLSRQVETMTQSLSRISSLEARQAALEAISNQLALISRLITYSGYLGQLLDVLRNNLSGESYASGEISRLVGQINAEVRAINNFNNQSVQAMQRFDDAVKR